MANNEPIFKDVFAEVMKDSIADARRSMHSWFPHDGTVPPREEGPKWDKLRGYCAIFNAAGHGCYLTPGYMDYIDGDYQFVVDNSRWSDCEAIRLDIEFGPSIVIEGHGDDCDQWIDLKEVAR